MGSKPWRATCAVLTLALAGCHTSVSSDRQILWPLRDAWRPDLLFVRSQPYPRLAVEVHAVQGCEPSPETLSALREFLVRHVDKPGGVEVVARPPIPPADARRMRLNQLLLSTLADAPADGPLTRQDTATIRILCYDSRQLRGKSDEGLKPHSNALPYPAQIYFDRAYMPAVSRRIEHVVLQHEVGHVLGLVGNLARGDGAHCKNDGCLMRPAVGVSWMRVELLRLQAALRPPCAECEADLTRSRASTADPRVRFVGPVLVRDEAGYSVASLPDLTVLCVGGADERTAGHVVRAARDAVASSDAELFTGWLIPDDLSPDATRAALERASRDPYGPIAGKAAALLAQRYGPSTRPAPR